MESIKKALIEAGRENVKKSLTKAGIKIRENLKREDLKFTPMDLEIIMKHRDWDLEDGKHLVNTEADRTVGVMSDGYLYIFYEEWFNSLKKLVILDKICGFYSYTLFVEPGEVVIENPYKRISKHTELTEALDMWYKKLEKDAERSSVDVGILSEEEIEFIKSLRKKESSDGLYIVISDELLKILKGHYGWYVTSSQKICDANTEIVGYIYEGNTYVYKYLEEVQKVLEEFENTNSGELDSSGYSQIYGKSLKDQEGETVLITTLVSDWKKYTEITGRTIIRVTLTNATEEERKGNDCISWIKRHVAEINGVLKLTFKCDCKIDVEEFMAVVITQIMGSWTPHYKVKEILNNRN